MWNEQVLNCSVAGWNMSHALYENFRQIKGNRVKLITFRSDCKRLKCVRRNCVRKKTHLFHRKVKHQFLSNHLIFSIKFQENFKYFNSLQSPTNPNVLWLFDNLYSIERTNFHQSPFNRLSIERTKIPCTKRSKTNSKRPKTDSNMSNRDIDSRTKKKLEEIEKKVKKVKKK